MSTGRTLGVVVPTHDTRDLTVACLAALADCASPADQVVAVDDGSSDGTADAIRRDFPGVSVVRNPIAKGFSAAANRGLATLDTDVLVLLNSDTLPSRNALTAWRRAFDDDPGLGIAGAALTSPDGRPQWSGGRLPTPLWLAVLASGAATALDSSRWLRRLLPPSGTGVRRRAVGWVTGAAMAIRRATWLTAGPLDEAYQFYGQDLELCWRAANSGWRIAIVPECQVVHHRGASITASDGAVANVHPERLWLDLTRFEERRSGPVAGARARAALRAGGRLRLLARQLRTLGVPRDRRGAYHRDTEAYRRALRALDSPAAR